MDRLAERLAERGFTDLRPLGRGLEFTVFRARNGDGEVAIRIGEKRYDSNVNDPWVDTRALLVQEYRLTGLLHEHGLPVAVPLDLMLSTTPDEPDMLVSQYVEDDGSALDSFRLGATLARLHDLRASMPPLTACEDLTPAELVVRRVLRRWEEIGRLRQGWPRPPRIGELFPIAAPLNKGTLLHLDVRRANVRCQCGVVTAILDWSNALRAHPVLEFGRLGEFARLEENQLDLPVLRSGYARRREPPPDLGPLPLLCRLDAAVMLALVFLSEAPDPTRAEAAVQRVLELHDRLRQDLDR